MKAIQNLIGGLAGALALNIIHQTAAHFDPDAPKVDLIGQEALSKGLKELHIDPPKGNKLFAGALGADLAGNALYYSLIGGGEDKDLIKRGAAYGLLAGVSALTLTEPLGLDDEPVIKTTSTMVMTVSWYLVGGLVTALTIKALRR
jgi:hypothetical protein